MLVNEQYQVEFQIGIYKDQVLCDIMSMDVCHVLLDKPWQFERNVAYDGRENTYTFEKNGRKHTLITLEVENIEEMASPKSLLISGENFFHMNDR